MKILSKFVSPLVIFFIFKMIFVLNFFFLQACRPLQSLPLTLSVMWDESMELWRLTNSYIFVVFWHICIVFKNIIDVSLMFFFLIPSFLIPTPRLSMHYTLITLSITYEVFRNCDYFSPLYSYKTLIDPSPLTLKSSLNREVRSRYNFSERL